MGANYSHCVVEESLIKSLSTKVWSDFRKMNKK